MDKIKKVKMERHLIPIRKKIPKKWVPPTPHASKKQMSQLTSLWVLKSQKILKNQKIWKFQFKKKVLHEMKKMFISSISYMNIHLMYMQANLTGMD